MRRACQQARSRPGWRAADAPSRRTWLILRASGRSRMADLDEELRRLADQAAGQARPLPSAQVLRRADQRRKRPIPAVSTALTAVALPGRPLPAPSTARPTLPPPPTTPPPPFSPPL